MQEAVPFFSETLLEFFKFTQTLGDSYVFFTFLAIFIIILNKALGAERIEKLVCFIWKITTFPFIYVYKFLFKKTKIEEANTTIIHQQIINIDYFSLVDRCLKTFEECIAEINTFHTNDLVKDMLLRDICECVFEAVKEELYDFAEKNKDVNDVEIILSNLYVTVNKISVNYDRRWKSKKIQISLIQKIYKIISELETVFKETFKHMMNFDHTSFSIDTEIRYICAHYQTLAETFKSEIKEMNGTLNGVEYKNKVIGLYNSFGALKIDRFPFPLGIHDADVSSVLTVTMKKLKCDYAGLVDFYETPEMIEDGLNHEFNVQRILDSKFAVSFASCPKKFSYRDFIEKRVTDLLTRDCAERLINNEVLIFDRSELLEWSNIRSFMAMNDFQTIVMQPILSDREVLIGLIVYLFIYEKDHSTDKLDKEYLKSMSARFVNFFRHMISLKN